MKLKPISLIKTELGIDKGGRVQKFFTDTCIKHMDKYVPKDIGNLRDNISKTERSVTYESPYAHAQYVGVVNGSPVKNYTTPGTGPYWDRRMVSAEMGTIVREVQNYVDR